MKRVYTISFVLLIAVIVVMAGCRGQKQSGNDDFITIDDVITVDVMKSYPKKNLILQDFMDVEYIPLETKDDFLTQGKVLAIGKDIIVIRNRFNDGDIFMFDRTTGKGLRKINHYGQGPEEYRGYYDITVDEDVGEMYVHSGNSIILIYDLINGKFKRSLRYREGLNYSQIHNFDQENLIGYDFSFNYGFIKESMHPLLLMSKQDGSITKEIQIPYKKVINTSMTGKFGANKEMVYSLAAEHYPIIPYFGKWILFTPSSDTIYNYLPDHTLTPLIARTPSIQTMNQKVFLFMNMVTDRYYFMEIVKKVFDPATNEYPSTDLVYDKQKNAIFECKVYNNDYDEKKPVSMKPLGARPENAEIATWQVLESYQLNEYYSKGQLKGRLKEIAAKLDKDSNPVIMLIKYKK